MSAPPLPTRAPRSGRRTRGFSMIEVLVSLLLLAFGLLGFALLQTMNLRFAQSANYRTQATNLAYDMLDRMRSNRLLAVQYGAATFTGGTTELCSRDVGAVSIAENIARWQCQVRSALGEGAAANVSFNPANGLASVEVIWGDERWNDKDRNGTVSADESEQRFTVTTRL